MMMRIATLLGVTALAGCAPSLTVIPTYWDPVYGARPAEPWPAATALALPREAPVKAKNDLDVDVKPDTPKECLSMYLVSHQQQLLAYDPLEQTFTPRGKLRCPETHGATPFSMAVSREGIAHVVYTSGRLYRVDVDDASCSETPFLPNQPPGFRLFGMGYSPEPDGSEKLHVAQIGFTRRSLGLATIDTGSYELQYIGRFSQNPGFHVELTPTGSGALHGYFLNEPGPGGTLVSIDTKSGEILEATPLHVGTDSSSLAVSWWGGYFFIFTSARGGTEVSRFDPKTRTTTVVTTIDQTIVGAGASTCAPERRKH